MMLCGLDIETTGLDWAKDHITEIGYIIKEYKDPKPMQMQSLLIEPCEGMVIPEMITELTKITMEHLEKSGVPLDSALARFWSDIERYKVDYIVAHNGIRFDKPFMRGYSARQGYIAYDEFYDKTPWLDTQADVVYPRDCASTSLVYVAAYLGFVNPFPHAAMFDAFTCLKVLESLDDQSITSMDNIVARSKEPWVVVRAMVIPPFKDPAPTGEKEADKIKKLRYRWQDCGDGKTYDKCWVKRIKLGELEREQATVPFKVVRIDDEA